MTDNIGAAVRSCQQLMVEKDEQMASVENLVHETSTSTGMGNFTVSAADGRQTFNAAFGTGGIDVFYYFLSHRTAGEWEVGTGHMSAATTLVRDTVIASSNAGSAVNFSAGTKDVTNDRPATQQPVLHGHIYGLVPAVSATDSSHDIDISNGQAALTDGTNWRLYEKSANLTKRIDATWAAGDDAGGFPSDLILSADTTYHVFVIGHPDGTLDAGFDTSLTATNLLGGAASYTFYRRIGSLFTDGSSNITDFSAVECAGGGLIVSLDAPVADHTGNFTTTTTATTLSVPSGIQVRARLNIALTQNETALLRVFEMTQTSGNPSTNNESLEVLDSNRSTRAHSFCEMITNTSRQIRWDASTTVSGAIRTLGWEDFRRS